MKILLPVVAFSLMGLVSCTTETKIDRVREIPLNAVMDPSFDTGMYRAQYTYFMRGALTAQQKRDRMGQYYYVRWSDAHTDVPTKLVMEYQLSSSASKVHRKEINFPAGRSRGRRVSEFKFIGEEYRSRGQVLTWKISVWENGKMVASHCSYLWRDDRTTEGRMR